MKKAIVLSAVLASAPSLAEDTRTRLQICTLVGETAEQMMRKRQDNAPPWELQQMAIDIGELDNAVGFKVYSLVESAYDVPVASGANNKYLAAYDFRDKAFFRCLKGNI